jgi:hypothetical protein
VGQPDVRDLRRASGRANRVVVICYSGRGANVWWNENKDELDRLQNLKILSIPQTESHALARLANRNMHLQCNIQDGALTFIEGEETMVQVAPVVLKTVRQAPFSRIASEESGVHCWTGRIARRYPTAGSVRMSSGDSGRSSIFFLMYAICTRRTLVSASVSGQISRMICVWVTTLPAFAARSRKYRIQCE